MVEPVPRAHHSREWKPFPEKRTARRTGGSLAVVDERRGSSPQTGSDSSQGRAMVTPKPRSKRRREKG